MSWQLHNSPGNCAGELFKPSKDSPSLQVCNEKKFLVLDFRFIVSDAISGVVLGLFGPLHLALGPNHWIVVFCSSFFWKLG